MASNSILLKNGNALVHERNPPHHVVPTKTDILITGNTITKIEANIEAPQDTDVIDCTDKIISPGFIDTHRHLWQTQLKGRHANQLLVDYMYHGNFQSSQYTPEDFFYGQLAGALESIAVGTTTIIDFAHLTYSPESARMGLAATISSGVRSTFCYTPQMRATGWNPMTLCQNPLEDWVLQTFKELGEEGGHGKGWAGGRVKLGLAWDMYFLPPQIIQDVFAQAKDMGVKTITTHYLPNPQFGPVSVIQNLESMGLLDDNVLVVHGNGLSQKDLELVKKAGVGISSTPSSELQMSMGRCVCFDEVLDIQDSCGLGVDCHANNSASIATEMRIGLQSARNIYNEKFLVKGKAPRKLPEFLSVERAFNLATLTGAKVVGMGDEIGSLEVGKKADICVWDALSPGMVGAAQHDPVAAIVLHSNSEDIEWVFVDGVARKKDGKLVDVQVDGSAKEKVGKATLGWRDVARQVVRSRERMQGEIDKIDFEEARKAWINILHLDESDLVDQVPL